MFGLIESQLWNQDIFFRITMLAFLLAVVLGAPSLPVGLWDLFGKDPQPARWLALLGPFAILVVHQVLSMLTGCLVIFSWCFVDPVHGDPLSGMSVHDRLRLLMSILYTLPMAGLYWLMLRKWHPAIARQ